MHGTHRILSHLAGGDVAEDDAIEPGKLFERLRNATGLAEVELDALLFHGLNQVLGFGGFAFGIKQTQAATHIHDGQRIIVGRQGVSGKAFQHRTVLVDVAHGGCASEGFITAFALFERDVPALDFHAVFIELEPARAVHGALKAGGEFERCSFMQARAAGREFSHPHIRLSRASD